jgi:CO/xanthine dehydrogenase FAD-binding subunit
VILRQELEAELPARGRLVEQQQEGMVRDLEIALAGSAVRPHLLDGLEAAAAGGDLELEPAELR